MQQEPKQLSQTAFLQLLKKEAIEVIEEPTEKRAINVSAKKTFGDVTSGRLERDLKEATEALSTYLSFGIYKDNSSNSEHNRAAFAKKHGADFAVKYADNRLRGNKIIVVFASLDDIRSELDRLQIQNKNADAVRKICEELPDKSKYQTLTPDERVTFVQMLSRKINEFLDIVSV